ncbi:MAG TPA: hypothetical protein PKZ76_04190 [Xanthomonadaceae bacterium]|nr:hypothetical protein [Xanthomonadaceae bacterium]
MSILLSRMLLAAFLVAQWPGVAHGSEAPSLAERLQAAAVQNRLRLDHQGDRFSGPAWEKLIEEGRQAQFFILGEEHGIAENPKFAGAVFHELASHGYSRVVIEISPPMASALDHALQRDGLKGLHDLYAQPGAVPAFYGMREEAEFLARVRARVPEGPLLWGTDYEVGGDRHLLRTLAGRDMPAAAREALDALASASHASWAQFQETGNPQFIFSFSGDPALVRAVVDAWPDRDDDSDWILHTLEETLEINRLWVSGQAWRSNERRAALLRTNFLRYWLEERKAGRAPRALFKFGASHVVRGRNMTDTFDLGALLPEIAALEGRGSFSVLVLPGAGTQVARFNPVAWSYQPAPAKDGHADGMQPILDAAFPDAFTLIDLRPLRVMVGMRQDVPQELARIVHGFDAVLVMTGSTPSTGL